MIRKIYNRDDWVLGTCQVCGQANYVGPHGTTAKCCMPEPTQHTNIPFYLRCAGGSCVQLTPANTIPIEPIAKRNANLAWTYRVRG